MVSVRRHLRGMQVASSMMVWSGALVVLSLSSVCAEESSKPAPIDVPNAKAATPAEMKPYTEVITGTSVTFDMVPIPGGKFMMGSPDGEKKRGKDEGPQHEVEIEPFWMGKHEVRWEEYETWSFKLDIQRRRVTGDKPNALDEFADVLTRPTAPYTDMTFGMGKEGYPAICMTQLAAKKYCEWLSAKTGRFYRLPTEAEWEYACRAGTNTAFSFGDDPSKLGDYAWYYDNAGDGYRKVGQKKPNPWGLYDIHGNVAEWVLDGYEEDAYGQFEGKSTKTPYVKPTGMYPRVARGGSWDDDPDRLRSAARRASSDEWKIQDPQLPQSIWYHTDAKFVGFRVIRPFNETDRAAQEERYRPDKWQLGED